MVSKSTASKSTGRRMRGFERADGLLQRRIRKAGEGRGFAVTRLLTHWAEIAGEEIASHTRPVRIGYGRGGLGATLTLLTTGAYAPMIQAQLPRLKEQVNAVYGYSAVSRIHLTQTAPEGFAEGRAVFEHREAKPGPEGPTAEVRRAASRAAAEIADDRLRSALENMGAHILGPEHE